MLQLLIATLMVTFTVLVHLSGLSALLAVTRTRRGLPAAGGSIVRQSGSILVAAFGLFALHTIEIWSYAVLYVLLGALGSFEESLYFSTVTYTTIGYGDLTLPKAWRILGAIEGANGLILLGWSTAFFVSVVDEIKRVEGEVERVENKRN